MGMVVRIVKGYIIGGSLLPSLGWLLWLSNYHHHPGGALLLNLDSLVKTRFEQVPAISHI